MLRYRTTILLGAFLLFQIQPQIARVILPWFGGGPAVWSACLLFFQVQLLAGYAYVSVAHLLPALVGQKGRRWARAVGWVAVTVHLITLGMAAVVHAHGPGFAEALSATSLGVGLAYAWVARGERLSALGMFLAPLALVLLGVAMVVPTRPVMALSPRGHGQNCNSLMLT